MAVRFWTPVEITARDDLGVVWRGQDEPAEHQVAGTPSGIGGWIDIVPREWAETVDAPPAGQWGYEALRIEAGIPRIGIDTDTRTIPNEIGLFGTALDKGCYPGQETVARVYNLGHPPRRLVRLLFDGSAPEPGAAIVVDGREVGRLTSSAQHFDLGPVGLGMIKRNIPTDALLKVAGVGASQEIIVDPEVGEHFRPSIGGQAHGSLL